MYMVNQVKKLLKTARQTVSTQGRVFNEKQAVMITILMGIASTPSETRYTSPLPPTCRLFLLTVLLEKESAVLLKTVRKLFWKDMLLVKESSLRAREPRERANRASRTGTGIREIWRKS